MFWRWFVGAYGVSLLAAIPLAWMGFPSAFPPVVWLLFVPFSLPFVLSGCLVGWGLQWGLERLLPAGWLRTTLLAGAAAAVGAAGMALVTHEAVYVVVAVCAAATGAILTQHSGAWRHKWLTLLLGAGIASGLVMVVLMHYLRATPR